MEKAFRTIPEYSSLILEEYFQTELENVNNSLLQLTEPVLVGREQGKGVYLLKLLAMLDHIKKPKKELDK